MTSIYPYLIYGNIVWVSNYDSRTPFLTLLPKRVMRVIAGAGTMPIQILGSKKMILWNLKIWTKKVLMGLFLY